MKKNRKSIKKTSASFFVFSFLLLAAIFSIENKKAFGFSLPDFSNIISNIVDSISFPIDYSQIDMNFTTEADGGGVAVADVMPGGSFYINWRVRNAYDCTISSNPTLSSWNGGPRTASYGSELISNLQASTTFTLTCASASGGGGITDSCSVNVLGATLTSPISACINSNIAVGWSTTGSSITTCSSTDIPLAAGSPTSGLASVNAGPVETTKKFHIACLSPGTAVVADSTTNVVTTQLIDCSYKSCVDGHCQDSTGTIDQCLSESCANKGFVDDSKCDGKSSGDPCGEATNNWREVEP